MRLLFFCPQTTVINGGIKQIFRLADVLRAQGSDAVVFEEQGHRPSWFPSQAPVVGQGVFAPRADEVLILPEDQPNILRIFKDWPQRKVLYAQNQFYGALSLGDVASFADYGITDALCCSRTIFAHMQERHAKLRSFLVPCGIDRTLFKPAPVKKKQIAFMTRKRPVEAAFVKDMFRFAYPACEAWEWLEIADMTEAQTAAALGESAVFLSMARLESLGLASLEAMACGCVIAGFTGLGGREYATDANGFWAGEDDFPACVAALRRAVSLAEEPATSGARCAYDSAVAETLAFYTPEAFAHGAKVAFAAITAV